MTDLTNVTAQTNERGARVEERCNYRVVGYVMEHAGLPKRAIVLGEAVRWFPSDADFTKMMGWQKHTDGPGIPDPAWPVDEMPKLAPIQVAAVAVPAAPKRPILTAPPTAKLIESTEDALGELARALGCVWNDLIPHNSGWFVPGKPVAYASAYDAIQGLVTRLRDKQGAPVSEPASAPSGSPRAPKAEAPEETAQESLF